MIWHQGENDQGADGPTGGFGYETYRQYFIDLAASWNIGDKERDLEMGRAAGIPHNLHFGTADFPDWASVQADFEACVPR